MAAYSSCFIAALLLIFSHLMNAHCSPYNGSTDEVKRHLRQEKRSSSSQSSSDPVCDLDEFDKLKLCEEVARHLIKAKFGDVLDRLLGDGNRAKPHIVKDNPLMCKDVCIEDLEILKPMYWCTSKRFRKQASGPNSQSNDDQIDGFFCAGSSKNDKRVYVFRTRTVNARKVETVAELNNCKLGEDTPAPESPDGGLSSYRFHEQL